MWPIALIMATFLSYLITKAGKREFTPYITAIIITIIASWIIGIIVPAILPDLSALVFTPEQQFWGYIGLTVLGTAVGWLVHRIEEAIIK